MGRAEGAYSHGEGVFGGTTLWRGVCGMSMEWVCGRGRCSVSAVQASDLHLYITALQLTGSRPCLSVVTRCF